MPFTQYNSYRFNVLVQLFKILINLIINYNLIVHEHTHNYNLYAHVPEIHYCIKLIVSPSHFTEYFVIRCLVLEYI